MSEEQQRLRYMTLAPEGMASLRGVEHYLNAESGLESALLEMVRLRASQMNGCSFCIGVHGRELARRNEPESRIAAVAAWRTTDALTERERAALRWTEAITDLKEGHASDAEYEAVRHHFADKELVDLTLAIASTNAWNRMGVAFRPQWDAARAGGGSGAAVSEPKDGQEGESQ